LLFDRLMNAYDRLTQIKASSHSGIIDCFRSWVENYVQSFAVIRAGGGISINFKLNQRYMASYVI